MNAVLMVKAFNGSTYFIASQINQYLHNNSITKNRKKIHHKIVESFSFILGQCWWTWKSCFIFWRSFSFLMLEVWFSEFSSVDEIWWVPQSDTYHPVEYKKCLTKNLQIKFRNAWDEALKMSDNLIGTS